MELELSPLVQTKLSGGTSIDVCVSGRRCSLGQGTIVVDLDQWSWTSHQKQDLSLKCSHRVFTHVLMIFIAFYIKSISPRYIINFNRFLYLFPLSIVKHWIASVFQPAHVDCWYTVCVTYKSEKARLRWILNIQSIHSRCLNITLCILRRWRQ